MSDDLTYLPAALKGGPKTRLTTLQKAQEIRKLELFSEASVEDLYRLADIAQEAEFAAGQVIYQKDDVGDAFYLILEGRIECTSESSPASRIATTGEAVGLSSVLIREARQGSAKAMEDTLALSIGAEDFYNLLSCNSEITVGLVKYFVKKVGMSL